MKYYIRNIHPVHSSNNIYTKADDICVYTTSSVGAIFSWNINVGATNDRQTISNIFNTTTMPYFTYDTDDNGNYTGSIIITQEGNYDIAVCCDHYNYCLSGKCNPSGCNGVQPQLYIYLAKDKSHNANSIGTNTSPECLDLGCLTECANKNGYHLNTNNVLHFKIVNTEAHKNYTAYFSGFVDLKPK
jgi:hypothetical protein